MNQALKIRPPAVAGMFYPEEKDVLKHQVDDFLAKASVRSIRPKVMVLPHAGYIYSGQCAAEGYKLLENLKGKISRVILLGPCHRVPVKGIALPESNTFSTPLGNIPLDMAVIDELENLPFMIKSGLAHSQEHSLEVHLPFLQQTLGDFSLIPLVVGQIDPRQVSELLKHLWGGEETLIIISSDLSHYHDYDSSHRIDSQTANKIVSLEGNLVGDEACGAYPLNGIIHLAQKKGLKCECINLCNSGDTAGDKNRVVGYGAFVFTETEPTTSSKTPEDQKGKIRPDQQNALLKLARDSIRHFLETGTIPDKVHIKDEELANPGACFVTLNKHGQLRGCIGSLEARQPLYKDIISNAISSAVNDPRFPKLSKEELSEIHIEISILTQPEPMDVNSETDLLNQLRPGIDGLVLEEGSRRSTFLPLVWEKLPDKPLFLSQLKRKAGLPEDYWSETIKFLRYETQVFEEPNT